MTTQQQMIADDLVDAITAAEEAMTLVANLVRNLGGRSSDLQPIRYFEAYGLADLEGAEGGWLGEHLIDRMRTLRDEIADTLPESEGLDGKEGDDD